MKVKNYIVFITIAILLLIEHFLLRNSSIVWVNMELHSAIEAIGGIIAVILAFMLITQKNYKTDYPFLYLLALSFMIIGLFDLAHSFTQENNLFVFLHTASGLFGSLILMIIFSNKTLIRVSATNQTFYTLFIITFLICTIAFLWPNLVPRMIVEGEFTTLSSGLNTLAGIIFIIFLVKLTKLQNQKTEYDYILFIYIFLLFAFSSLTFFSSKVWNIDWWIWHFFRLLAYLVVVFILIKNQKNIIIRLQEKNSELDLYQRELMQANELLISKNKELEQYTYITSHDLQEPLNSIISFSSLLEGNKDKLDEMGKRSIEVIVKSAFRMKEFIISLLEFSRIGREKEKKEVDINQLIDNLVIDLHDLIEKKQASINYIGEPIKVVAYEQDLIKLFQNLVTNGIKYTDDKTKPSITINSEEQSDRYKFTITDNGIGIAEEQYNKVFEVFQRLHSRDKYSGTGIGLSHCKKVVELHNGEIWLTSEIGKGTEFYFTISKL